MEQLSRIYFIGIGGIGMSALARYFHGKGLFVSGYDRTETELTRNLQQEGMTICFEDDVALLDKDADLVVYTPAIPADHQQLNYYRDHGYQLKKRSQVLGELTHDHFTIAVAGSHGKTTTSSMIAWILRDSGYDCTAFLGGICVNFESNFVQGANQVIVVEADEFDRSFHTLHPDIAVVTAIDSDHLEIYGTQEALEENFLVFAKQIHDNGLLIHKQQVTALQAHTGRRSTYSLRDDAADLYAVSTEIGEQGSRVILSNGFDFVLEYPGIHNIENAIAATCVALELGISEEAVRKALRSFRGIHRRFEVVWKQDRRVLIDDYAHHPEEIRMFINSLRAIYPGKQVEVVFQPHLYTRTRDLATDFAGALDLADHVVLLPIYPARELPIPGIDANTIARHMKGSVRLLESTQLQEFVQDDEHQVIAMVGAGNIDQLVRPMASWLEKKYSR